jgi:hypothetical protein|tara:strand:+ start:323 stop:778 length:456 start_codon:yes stop_codon:yes gene_type:complete
MKIHLNKKAQDMLFGYYEGVDWHIDLCVPNPNPKKSPADDYVFMSEKEQDRIWHKVINWITDYKVKYNGKFSEMKVDKELAFYLSGDARNQSDLITTEILEHDVEDIFEDYWCYNTKRQKRRVKLGKENLFKEYKLAQKQLDKLSKIDERI